ncbi:MAG TPA: hypothetical protein VGR26_05675 [Acidimicrobiales bacterium]|nr:hypothetical protein [Acidimicrobiales bacterium]
MANHMAKGRRVGVAGEYREWKSAEDVPYSIYEVVAAQGDFLDAPPVKGEPTYGDDEEAF